MCRLFAFISCIVIAAGNVTVSNNGIVKVKRGENFSLCVKTSELKMVSRFTARKGTQEVFRYCSPEEQNHGCKPINSERCSLQTGNENICATCLHSDTGDDEGVYEAEVIGDKNKSIRQECTVELTEQLPSSINTEPPSSHPFTTSAISTEVKETFTTNATSTNVSETTVTTGPNTKVSTERDQKIIWIFVGGLSAIIEVVIVFTGVICYKKKKQNNHPADDAESPGEWFPLNFFANRAGEPATDERLEIVVERNSSVDIKEGPVHGA